MNKIFDRDQMTIRDLLSVDDLRTVLGIGRTKAYGLLKSGELRSIRIGKKIRVPKPDLLEFLENCPYNTGTADRLPDRKEGNDACNREP